MLTKTWPCLLAFVLLAAACGTHTASLGVSGSPPVPFPADRLASATDISQNGTDAEQMSSGATPQGTSLLLDASQRTQYAIFRFNVPNSQFTSIDISLDTVGTSNAYVGLANYATGRWVFTGPYSGPTTLPIVNAKHVSPLDNIYVAILAAPGGQAKIDQETLHGNRKPLGSFTMTPDNGNPPLNVDFNASASTDPDGNIVSYEWDFNADNTVDDTGSTVSHLFATPGTYPVKLILTDSDGAVGELVQNVVVHGWSTGRIPGDVQVTDFSAAIVSGRAMIACTDPGATNLLFLAANDAAANNWTATRVIDNVAGGGISRPAFADINGNPAVAYRELTSTSQLAYIRALDVDGQNWPADGSSIFDAGPATLLNWTLANVNGTPAVAYQDFQANNMVWLHAQDAAGSAWDPPLTIDTGSGDGWTAIYGYEPSIADVGGRPAIASSAFFAGSYDLLYTRANDVNGDTWPVSVSIGHYTAGMSCGSSTLLMVNGNPAVGHWAEDSSTTWGLKFLRATDAIGGTWGAVQTLFHDDAYSLDFPCTTAIVNGKPAIAFNDKRTFGSEQVSYVAATDADGTAWGAPVQLGLNTALSRPRLILLGSMPAIVYADETGHLCLARLN